MLFVPMVTMSVQLVGVCLGFTTLIVPVLATYRHGRSRQVSLGYLVALASCLAALAISLLNDLPSSPANVWAMAVLGVALHLTAKPAPGAGRLRRAAARAAGCTHVHPCRYRGRDAFNSDLVASVPRRLALC